MEIKNNEKKTQLKLMEIFTMSLALAPLMFLIIGTIKEIQSMRHTAGRAIRKYLYGIVSKEYAKS